MLIKSEIETKLDAEILSLLAKLKETTKDSEDYVNLVDRVSKLHKLKSEEAQNQIKIEEILYKVKADKRLKPPSSDTMLIVAANIFGILWLARYERTERDQSTESFRSHQAAQITINPQKEIEKRVRVKNTFSLFLPRVEFIVYNERRSN